MYHSFLIHSSADGHLGCFHVLAMINRGTSVFEASHRKGKNKRGPGSSLSSPENEIHPPFSA